MKELYFPKWMEALHYLYNYSLKCDVNKPKYLNMTQFIKKTKLSMCCASNIVNEMTVRDIIYTWMDKRQKRIKLTEKGIRIAGNIDMIKLEVGKI